MRLTAFAIALALLAVIAAGCESSSTPPSHSGGNDATTEDSIGAPGAPDSTLDASDAGPVTDLGGGAPDGASGGDEDTSGPADSSGAGNQDDASAPEDDGAGEPDGPDGSAGDDDAATDGDAQSSGDAADGESDAGAPGPCPAGETKCEVQDVQVCTGAGDWVTVATCPEATPCFGGACCTPFCDPLAECGSDGCGGSCGGCPDGLGCVAGSCQCVPDCDGKDCGDDGCGGTCGQCADDDVCLDGVCTCTPECGDAVCGDDGCGGSCGECPVDNECIDGTCVGPCAAGDTRCSGQDVQVCGPDGESWITVASCPAATPCFGGACCTPACSDDMECGGDGCGGSCGTCAEGLDCVEDLCICVPDCGGAECGGDGCGGSCGVCAGDLDTCVDGQCLCEPSCGGAICGDDGCGGTCGTCGAGLSCVGGQCLAPCDPGDTICDGDTVLVCDEFGAFVTLLDCGEFDQLCDEGSCVDPPPPACPVEACVGTTQEAAQCALELCDDPSALGIEIWSPSGSNFALAYTALEHYGTPSNGLEPRVDPSYLLISTGAWTDMTHQSDLGGIELPDPFAPGGAGANDVIEVILDLQAPADATGFAFDSMFLSVEYEEWIGSGFNDKFYTVLDAPVTTAGLLQVINAGPCSDASEWSDYSVGDEDFCFISVNSAFSEPCSNPLTDLTGTGFECASGGSGTGWMSTRWPIAPNEQFTLTFHLHDGADSSYDSAVLLDNFRWLTDEFVPGTESLTVAPPCQPQCDGKECGSDECGNACGTCGDAEYCSADGQCVAPPEDAIVLHVVWDTPLDPDQTDEGPGAGADLDLHFAHPAAATEDIDLDGEPDPWFDQLWDCFWFNPSPVWVFGEPSADDDPTLDLDDTDGAGPEIISLGAPVDGSLYRVGVHYWSDHDYGVSSAQVKVFIYGELVSIIGPVMLEDKDMWSVATIEWPGGLVTPTVGDDGQPKVTPEYENPSFFSSP